jgi:hypothetical protein
MAKQNLINRLNTLEQNNKTSLETEHKSRLSIKDKNLNKFFDSLPSEDQRRIYFLGGDSIVFIGEKEEWERIIKPFGEVEKYITFHNKR